MDLAFANFAELEGDATCETASLEQYFAPYEVSIPPAPPSLPLEEDLESYSSSMDESDEEDEEEDGVEAISQLQLRMEDMYLSFPQEPEDATRAQRLVFWMYHATHYCIFYMLYNDHIGPPVPQDTDDQLRDKAYGIHCNSLFRKYRDAVAVVAAALRERLETDIRSRDPEHPLLQFIAELVRYEELHTRRVKGSPAIKRTKLEINHGSAPIINLITGAVFDQEACIHPKDPKLSIRPDVYREQQTWKMLILNPSPSDYDENAPTVQEGDEAYRCNIEVARLSGSYPVPDAYAVVVTNGWDKVLRMLHTFVHMDYYLQIYMVAALTSSEIAEMETRTWHDAWLYVAGEHADKSIYSLSREKKKTPLIISRLAEMRDLIYDTLKFLEL